MANPTEAYSVVPLGEVECGAGSGKSFDITQFYNKDARSHDFLDILATVGSIITCGLGAALPNLALLWLFDALSSWPAVTGSDGKDRVWLLHGIAWGLVVVLSLLRSLTLIHGLPSLRHVLSRFGSRAVPLVMIVPLLAKVYQLVDQHWYYVNHTIIFLFGIYFVGHVYGKAITVLIEQPSTVDADPLSRTKDVFVRNPGFVLDAVHVVLLFGASILRYKFVHGLGDNSFAQYGVYSFFLAAKFGINFAATFLFMKMQQQDFDGLRSMGINVKTRPDELRLARLRDGSSSLSLFYFAFATKLLATALPTWYAALLASAFSNIAETMETAYSVWKEARRLRSLESELECNAKEESLCDADSQVDEATQKTSNMVRDARVALVMYAVKYMSAQMSEYTITLTVIMAGVIFDGNAIVTGFNNGWDMKYALYFLISQFVPEFVTDIVGLYFLRLQGVEVGQMFRMVHRDLDTLSFKVVTLMLVVIWVVAVSQERCWGA